MASGAASQVAVDWATSVNKKVTVPVGSRKVDGSGPGSDNVGSPNNRSAPKWWRGARNSVTSKPSDHGHRVDFDEETRLPQCGNTHEGARWDRIGLPVFADGRLHQGVERRRGVVDDVDGQAGHVRQARPGRLQCSSQVAQSLHGLLRNRLAGQTAVSISPSLTRHVDDALTLGNRDVRGTWNRIQRWRVEAFDDHGTSWSSGYLPIIGPSLDRNIGQVADISGQRYRSEPDRHRLGKVRERSARPPKLGEARKSFTATGRRVHPPPLHDQVVRGHERHVRSR